MERPSKRARMLDDEDASDLDTAGTFKINEEYAKRHEHNAARAEKHRLEEKYKNATGSDSDSESESEDEGELATAELDDEILATLEAIRSKDPKVYDKSVQFYTAIGSTEAQTKKEKSKPLHLRDYHRQNLLNEASNAAETPISTYDQEQSAIKQDLLSQMHKLPDGSDAEDDDEEVGDLFVRKAKPEARTGAELGRQQPELDVTLADKDPEGYLSNFMASRSWAVGEKSRFEAFESDQEDEDDAADTFERAYNMRFENPAKANETLTSHSRAAAEKYSVRREEPKGRKRARQEEKAERDAGKQKREEEKGRLRRLKTSEAQEKWNRLKEAAGLKRQYLPDDKLVEFLEKGFETEKWDDEMAKLLGESYYDEKDGRPEWEDEIDIGDIVPEFDEEKEGQGNSVSLSDDGAQAEGEASPSRAQSAAATPKDKHKDAGRMRAEKKRQGRLERRRIEELVDKSLDLSLPEPGKAGFRYRETSPTAFGLSARDILMADDASLNQYAGLKKLAAFRQAEKKAKDKRTLGKKRRLREWRKETFGKGDDGKGKADSSGDLPDENAEFERWFNRSRGIGAGGESAGKQGRKVEKGKKRKKSEKMGKR